MHAKTILSCLMLLTLPVIGLGQSIRLTLADGSQVRGELLTPSLTVETEYGSLVVPTAEIRSIAFGIHGGDAAAALVKSLGSAVHRERETATLRLQAMGRTALPAVRQGMKSADAETRQRSETVYLQIVGRDPGAADAPALDTVVARKMTAIGQIKLDALRIRSGPLGEITVKLADCRAMTFSHQREGKFALDAAKHGSTLDQWKDAEIDLEKWQRLVVTAGGTVDLWPQGPGQYTTGPKGYSTAGKGGQFMAGALIGRIGDGQPFFIGERFDGAVRDGGRLFLLIVPSPWNNPSSGEVRVEVRAGD